MHLCENKSKECNNFAILDVSLIQIKCAINYVYSKNVVIDKQ